MINPAYLWIPPRVGSYGDEAVDLVRVARPPEMAPDEEQCQAIDAMLSYGPGGRWVALEAAILESRQNGKTDEVLLPVTLFDLYLLPPDRIVWTAHLFRTARDSFDAFCACVAYSPELSRRTKKISYSHGEEYIETTAGAKLEFLARERGGGRGLGGKRVVFDEALILSASAMGALLPVLSARDDPQVNYGSSAAKRDSTQLHSIVRRGRKGGDPSLIYIEYRAAGSWSRPPCSRGIDCPHVVGTDGCALDDEARWLQANHAMRHNRITVEYVRAERRALPPLEFGRERLGWEEEAEDESTVIDLETWARWFDPQTTAQGVVSLSLDVHPDLQWAAIGETGRRADGLRHWKVLVHGPGMGWLLEQAIRVNQRKNCGWSVDPSSPAGALIPELENAGLVVHRVKAQEAAQACTSMLAAAVDGTGRHGGDLDDALTQAWKDAATIPAGDSVRFGRKKSSGDITPLMVVTLSDHGFRVHEPAAYDLMKSFL